MLFLRRSEIQKTSHFCADEKKKTRKQGLSFTCAASFALLLQHSQLFRIEPTKALEGLFRKLPQVPPVSVAVGGGAGSSCAEEDKLQDTEVSTDLLVLHRDDVNPPRFISLLADKHQLISCEASFETDSMQMLTCGSFKLYFLFPVRLRWRTWSGGRHLVEVNGSFLGAVNIYLLIKNTFASIQFRPISSTGLFF